MIKQFSGRLVDCKKGNIRGLAFFPVVAISTNLSTNLLGYKETKKNVYKNIYR